LQWKVQRLLTVKTPEEVLLLLEETFKNTKLPGEQVPLSDACGRRLREDIKSLEYVPGFNRSMVDGFAVRARDTFGCSDSIPALLQLAGEIHMGEAAAGSLEADSCYTVWTGGEVPDGADAVVMLEYTEHYGDDTIGVLKPVAPGNNVIFKGDDVSPGQTILPSGHSLAPHDIGTLAALGVSQVTVSSKPVVGIISTGDELVAYNETPARGQVRDVNTKMLEAIIVQAGGTAKTYGIIRDIEEDLLNAVRLAVSECDMVLISGGSSVGMKDATARVIETDGEILLHGIAMKPGKPTILGVIDQKPVFGLPGHPVAAYFVAHLFVRPLIALLTGGKHKNYSIPAVTSEAISSNHGRAEYIAVILESLSETTVARPIHSKSGLISSVTGSDGYICVPRDCEGLLKGAAVTVTLWNS
jgi:molybdopterin molybdotransferase